MIASSGTDAIPGLTAWHFGLGLIPLTSILALPQGETSVTQRYVPPTGWEPGSWSFVVLLHVVDATTGTATTVATLDTIPPVEVGP